MMVMDHERQRIVGKGNERDGNGQSTWGGEVEGAQGRGWKLVTAGDGTTSGDNWTEQNRLYHTIYT